MGCPAGRQLGATGLKVVGRRLGERNLWVPLQSLINPSAQDSHLLRGQFGPFLGHGRIRIGSGHQVNEIALSAVAYDHRRPRLTGLEKGLARVDFPIAVGLAATVAFDATGLENGLNIFAEVDSTNRGRRQFLDSLRRGRGGRHSHPLTQAQQA